MKLKFDEFFLNFYISRSSGGLINHRAKKKIVEFLIMAAIPEKSWGILPTSDSSYEKWLNGTRTFDPAVWQEIAEKYKEDRFLEMVIKELNDGVLVTVMDRFGIKVATVNEIDKELFIVAVGNQFHEIAKGSGSADNIVKNIYENTKSKKLFPVYGQKALAEYSKVKTNFSDELCDMEKVFICNTLSTVDSAYSRRGLPARGTVIQDATLDKIAEQSNMVALIANGGMGKTMMLRHLFVESMKKYSETGVMPILVELRDYRFAGCDLFNSIVKSVNLFDVSFNERAAEKVLRAGKCQILLDGLDEIDPSDIVGFQHGLRDMIKTYPLNQYVITSRECDVAKSIGFRSRLYLMPFDEKQTGDLIDKLVSDDSIKAEITRNLNEGYLNKHGEFASNPMLLTFCIMNYPSYQSFYDRPHEFYRSAYDTISSDHDLEKSPLDRVFRSVDSRDDFTDVFREFCAVSYVERKFQFNKMTFEAIFKKLKSTKQVANPRIMNKTNFLHDACATACMMYEAKSDILYIDPGFQQFLFAEYNYFADPEEVEAMGKKLWTVPESEFNGGIAFEMLYELSDEKVEVCLDLPYLDMVFKDKTDEESFNAFLVHGFREIKSALIDRGAIAEYEQKSGIIGKYAIASKSEPKSVILSMMLKRLNMDMDDPSAMIVPSIDIGFDKFDIECEDTLTNPQHWDDEPFELIVSNPPYSIKWAGNDNPLLINDPRFAPAGVLAPKSKADMAFIMHSLSWLAPNGTAAIVCFPGIMYRGGAEKKIRQYMVDNNYIDCIIQLPSNLFFGTSIATCIMVMKKGKKDNNILFIDATNECIKVTNNNKLTDNNIENIVKWFVERGEVEHTVHLASYDEIVRKNYNLSVSTYVEAADNREKIDIKKLNAEISEIVEREQLLRDEIEKIIAEIEG